MSTQYKDAEREIRTLFELRHPNVIGFIGWFRSPRPGFLMEYAAKGNIREAYLSDAMGLSVSFLPDALRRKRASSNLLSSFFHSF